jgi:hypothetical protein
MNIFIAGDIHGEVAPLYERVMSIEQRVGVKADWVLQTGNFGIWPDPMRADRKSRQDNKIDFYKYYLKHKAVPRPTVFIAGKHEDHRWLKESVDRGQLDVLPDLTFLINGFATQIANKETVSLVGLGKVYSPLYFEGKRPNGKKRLSHYTRAETTLACSHGAADILITHEAPRYAHLGSRVSEADGVTGICHVLQPKLHIHGHHNVSKIYQNPTTGTTTISLAHDEVRALQYKNGVFTLLDCS